MDTVSLHIRRALVLCCQSKLRMEISKKKTSWGLILKLEGNLDMYSSIAFKDGFEKYVNDRDKEVLLDMQDILYMDSSGVGVLIKFLNHCKERDSKISIANLKPAIEKIFKVSGLIPYFNILSETESQDKLKQT